MFTPLAVSFNDSLGRRSIMIPFIWNAAPVENKICPSYAFHASIQVFLHRVCSSLHTWASLAHSFAIASPSFRLEVYRSWRLRLSSSVGCRLTNLAISIWKFEYLAICSMVILSMMSISSVSGVCRYCCWFQAKFCVTRSTRPFMMHLSPMWNIETMTFEFDLFESFSLSIAKFFAKCFPFIILPKTFHHETGRSLHHRSGSAGKCRGRRTAIVVQPPKGHHRAGRCVYFELPALYCYLLVSELDFHTLNEISSGFAKKGYFDTGRRPCTLNVYSPMLNIVSVTGRPLCCFVWYQQTLLCSSEHTGRCRILHMCIYRSPAWS